MYGHQVYGRQNAPRVLSPTVGRVVKVVWCQQLIRNLQGHAYRKELLYTPFLPFPFYTFLILIYKIWVWVPQSLIHFFCNLTQDLNGWSVVKERTYVLSLSNSHSPSHAHKYREWQINIPQSRDQRYYRNCQPIDLLFTGTHHLHHPISCKLRKVCAMLLCVLYIHSYLRKKVRLSFFLSWEKDDSKLPSLSFFQLLPLEHLPHPLLARSAMHYFLLPTQQPNHHITYPPPPHLSTIRKGYVSQMKKMDRKTTSFPLKLRRPLFCMRLFF